MKKYKLNNQYITLKKILYLINKFKYLQMTTRKSLKNKVLKYLLIPEIKKLPFFLKNCTSP